MNSAELEVVKDLFNVVADIAVTSGIYSQALAEKMAELRQKIDGLPASDDSEEK